MALGMRQVMTPNGMILVPEDQAMALGLSAPESPVPDAAVAGSGLPDPMVPDPAPTDQGLVQIDTPAVAPVAAPEPAPPQPTAPAPSTPADAAAPVDAPAPAPAAPAKPLSQTTYDDLATHYAQDTQAQQAAAVKVGEAEAQQAAEVANAMQERDRLAAEKIAEMDQKRAADEKAIAQKEQVWQAKQDEWMKAKVTRRGMSTGELVMAAIAGLGSAFKGQGDQNPALGVIMSNIQRDVDDQIRERDELGKQAGALKGAVDYAREVASNAQAQRQAAYGLEMQRQAQMLETVSKRMEPGIKRANMEQTAAVLGAQGTQLYGQALQAQHAEDAQKAALAQQERESKRAAGVQYARIAADKEKNRYDFTVQMADMDMKRMEKFQSATTAQEQEAIKREVPDLQMSNGQMYQARDEKVATDVATRFASSQSVVNLANDLKRMRQKYGNKAAAMQSPEWQRIVSTSAAIGNSIRTAEQMGTLDNGSIAQMNKMMGGGDLRDGITDAMLGALWDPRGNPTAGIEQLKTNTASKFNDYAKAMRHPRGPEFVPWVPPSLPDDKPIETKDEAKVKAVLGEKTPDEARAAAKPGVTARVLQAPGALPGIPDAPTNKQRSTEAAIAAKGDAASGDVLLKSQRQTLDAFQKAAAGADAEKAASARKSLVAAATGAYGSGRYNLGDQALIRLMVAGDESGVEEVTANLLAGATSQDEIDKRMATVRYARMQAELLTKPAPKVKGALGRGLGLPEAK